MKRLLILMLVLLLTAGALAETASTPVDEAVAEIEVALSGPAMAAEDDENPEEAPSETPTETEAPTEPEDAGPTVLSVTKSVTKTVQLGTAYRIEVPDKKVKSYKSSATKIVKVNKEGLLTLKKAGKAKITITLSNKKTLKLTLKVVDPKVPTGIVIAEGKKSTLIMGETLQLNAIIEPPTADPAVRWKSSAKSVAKVDAEGVVTPVKSGTATITATTSNGLKATYTVTVRKVATAPFMISHAMGGIGGTNYSNCLEAFNENYAEGHRVFEVDIELTSDGRMVLWHDWKRAFCSRYKAGVQPSFAQFMGSKIYDRYTPMSIENLLMIMHDHPDIRVITDSKYAATADVKKQFKALVKTAAKLGVEEVLDQFIVEIYNQSMYRTIESIHHFNDYVFTLYKLYKKAPSKDQLKTVARFCAENDVFMIAMYARWWKPAYMDVLDAYDIDAGLYTTNSASEALTFFDQGVTALFTDFLPPV